jgi:hypothetical protein
MAAHNQLNLRWEFTTVAEFFRTTPPQYSIINSGEVKYVVTRAIQLTHRKLLKQSDWTDWQESEYLQLNQYFDQGMFGTPHIPNNKEAIFFLVWTYNIKAIEGRKKACCVCDGSPRAGQARTLDETNANCIDQTSLRLFYVIAAGKNLLIFGANVSNTSAEAPPPKQGFYIFPDKAFIEWWTMHKKFSPLPAKAVIPVLSAMQGHPKSPRLWEKHADAILQDVGLTPTVHKPCLYASRIKGKRVLLKCQVEDFAVAVPDERTANILLDMIDDFLLSP